MWYRMEMSSYSALMYKEGSEILLLNGADIRFPNLGIELEQVGKVIDLFGIQIAYYGVIIAAAMIAGFFMAEWQASRTGQDKEIYLDFALYAVVFSVIGARLYYVIFSWDQYKDNLLDILNLRGGGLAIYGGILAAVITAYIYAKIKKISFLLLADTGCIGLITGQIIGRFGNFFNREAFGGYTDNLFAMQLKRSQVYDGNITKDILDHLVYVNGTEYIQVHPTFLYESLWNLLVLIFLIFFTKRKKFDGELVLLYFTFYGLGRIWIEGLRTDQLLLWGTNVAASQLLSGLLIVVSICLILWKRVAMKRKKV